MSEISITYVGGPTALLELVGLRLLTDPTFDDAGRRYNFGWGTSSRKLQGPALAAAELEPIDAVLLSHDQHDDNLDDAGRAVLPSAGRVITTRAAAGRLGGNSTGLGTWESTVLEAPGGGEVRVTATPCKHGPLLALPLVGEVAGFVLEWEGQRDGALWVTGDTVYFRGVAEVAERFEIGTALVHLGGVRFPVTGPGRYTMNAADAVRVTEELELKTVVPIHYEGWKHFRQGREEAERAFAEAGIADRVRWPVAAEPLTVAGLMAAAGGPASRPDPNRTGGLEWVRSTSGKLTPAERRRALGVVARGQAENLAGRIKLTLGRLPEGAASIDAREFAPPDSRLAREAEAACAEQPGWVAGHGYRTWMFGLALAALDREAPDPEVFYCAALLHDFGIVEPRDGIDFTLGGAERAIACAEAAGAPAVVGETAADAICVHTTAGVTIEHDGPVGCYVQFGAMVDVAGLRLWDISPANREEALRRNPREPSFKRDLTAAVRAEAKAVPGGRFALLVRCGFPVLIRLAPLKP